MFIAILATNIMSAQDKLMVKGTLDELLGTRNWSIDLGDTEKILRVSLKENILSDVALVLRTRGFESSILNVYHSGYGIDYPLLALENGNPAPTFISHSLFIHFFPDRLQF